MDRSIQWGIASVCGVTGALLLLMMILCSRSYKRRKKLASNQVNNDPTNSLQLRDLGQRQSTRHLHERRSDRKKLNEGEIMSRDITKQNGNSESDIQGGKSNKNRSSFFVKKTEANQNKLSENTLMSLKNGRSSFFAKKTQTDQERQSANRSSKVKKDKGIFLTKESDASLVSDSFVKTIPDTQGGSINKQSIDQHEHSTNELFSRSKSLVFSRSQDKGDRVSFHSLQNFPMGPVRIPRARLPSVGF